MICAKCKAKNPEGLKFCNECGAAFKTSCASCGFENAPAAKFCGNCGGALKGVTGGPIKQLDSSAIRMTEALDARALEGERKTVTALFADIKGSMELMQDLDPEEARAIIDPALKLMIAAVHRYDGYLVQSTGDGIFALFGAPAAHEDHPQRALYTALRLQEDVRRHAARLRELGKRPIEARVGVNTGEVVVRSLTTGQGHAEYTPIGHSTSLAARMQSLAPTGSIAATEQVRKLCEGYFTFKSLGPAKVKGVAEPINVHEVTGLGALRTHFQVSVRRGLTKFVGRQPELEQMKHALELAKGGHGGLVAAAGDPGVGKSRLFYEFKAIAGFDCKVLEAYSVSHGKATSYLPVIELLKDYFEIARTEEERGRRERVNGKIVTLDRSLEDTLPYIFALLGVNESEDGLAQMDPQIKRRRTLEAIKRILLRESLNQPLIIVFEDLHWIDAETQALLDLLVDAIANARILLLVNYRSEYRHDWGGRTYYTQLRLDPLGNESAAGMLTALLGDEPELEPLKQLIAEKTEGNAFFVEEMVQAFFEQGVIERNGKLTLKKSLFEVKIPPTVQALLAARIDRLPADQKALLQTLAVIGRACALPLIRSVDASSEAELEDMLGQLQRGEFIYEQPAFPDAEYTFKHALTQEVAYGSILIERRKLLHEGVGAALESLYAGRLEECCETLAHHYGRSGNTSKAVRYLHLAGQQAMRRSAHTQGINQFHSSLELLRTLPVNRERVEQELALQIDAGLALGQTKGYSAREAGEAFIRARELCRQLDKTPRVVQVLWGLWYFYFARAEHQAARDVAEECMTVARGFGQEPLIAQASFILGGSQLLTGELSASQESWEYGIRSYDRHSQTGLAFQYGQDPKVSALCPVALVYWHRGYPERGLQTVRQAQIIARAESHPYSQTFAVGFTSWIHLYRGEAGLAKESAATTVSLATDHGFPLWLGFGRVTEGRALAQLGQLEKGIDLIYEGMSLLESIDTELQLTFLLALLARTQRELGHIQQALATVDDALKRVGRTTERYFEPELYRLRGELLQESGDAYLADARTCFERGIEVAREQTAKSWELLATTSLARLLKKQGRRSEAREMLAEIYNWFTEGFDTADLKEAKALLEGLSE
jgi:class 3 adenylate cyclase/predicted ATPase